jgi:porphobilinogen synthase
MSDHISKTYDQELDKLRRLVAETILTPADLVWPLIVHDGAEDRVPVASMPGVFRLSPKAAAASR